MVAPGVLVVMALPGSPGMSVLPGMPARRAPVTMLMGLPVKRDRLVAPVRPVVLGVVVARVVLREPVPLMVRSVPAVWAVTVALAVKVALVVMVAMVVLGSRRPGRLGLMVAMAVLVGPAEPGVLVAKVAPPVKVA